MSVLDLSNARRDYGDIAALDGLTLTVEAGEIHAIVGLNGAGKTTAMKAIVGHTALNAGSVALFGNHTPGPAEFARLGFVIDHPFGYPELSVRDNIAFAARLHGAQRAAALAAADTWVNRLELTRWGQRRAREL